MLRAYYSDTGVKSDVRRLLALAVRENYGIPCPGVEKLPSGKPWFPSCPALHFSLSHTKTHVMVVLGDAPCGCDIELVRSVKPSVASYVCSEEELRHFDFFPCWVLKESFIKVYGETPLPLRKINFSPAGGEIATPSPRLRARLYDAAPCAAAVCCEGEPPASLTFIPRQRLAISGEL